ncbi:MAG: hypothetical protein HEP71_05180 [Roseivirga sp.]|nr:hypothetical protein [Roseivirga sp.]
MSDKKEFYIGYLPKAPKGISRFTVVAVLMFFILLAASAYVVVSNQTTINNGSFEYGELTEVEGLVYMGPQPFIKVIDGEDLNGYPVFKNILLINFGKHGATPSLEKIRSEIALTFDRVYVKLRGTLIYHNGTTLLELTENEKSYISYRPLVDKSLYLKDVQDFGVQTLTGEIIDPKCYFGSMKPGEGKPHKSCAGLCISGGIPPMYVVKNDQGKADYYLIMGENGQRLNEEVIPYVSDVTTISGRVETLDEWKVVYVDPNNINRE